MNEIIQKLVYEVDGQQFDTLVSAQEFASARVRQRRLQALISAVSYLGASEVRTSIKCIIDNWEGIKKIMEENA